MRLNPNDFTEKALKALQDAQTFLASTQSNLMKPEHLLYSVVEQDDEYVNEIFDVEDLDSLLNDLDNAISEDIGMRYSGPVGGLYLSNNLARALEIAKKELRKLNQHKISLMGIVLGIFLEKNSMASKILNKYTNEKIIRTQLKKQIDENDEEDSSRQRDPLKKYTIDLTEEASKGKLTPVIGLSLIHI